MDSVSQTFRQSRKLITALARPEPGIWGLLLREKAVLGCGWHSKVR